MQWGLASENRRGVGGVGAPVLLPFFDCEWKASQYIEKGEKKMSH